MYKTVEGRWGTVKFFLKDEYVGRALYNYGEYGPDETEKIIALADGLCLDIGANIGCISQALVMSGFDVIAFEPQPEVYTLLAENADCISYNVALGSEAGTAMMPRVHYSEKNNIGGLGLGMQSIYGQYPVAVRTLDSFIFDNVGFIKIDVEGYELEVLKGAVETIARCRPILYIEDDRIEKRTALREFIVSLDYTIEEHQPTLYRENNFFGLKKNVWDKNYASHNLICMPCF